MPSTLVLYDLRSDAWERLLPEGDVVDPTGFAEGEHVYDQAADGCPIPALRYRPPGVVRTRRPALVRVHGGPNANWTRAFDPFVQALTARGFIVLAPNVRGSTAATTRASRRACTASSWTTSSARYREGPTGDQGPGARRRGAGHRALRRSRVARTATAAAQTSAAVPR